MRIWLDDLRAPPDDTWTHWVKSGRDFAALFSEYASMIREVSFDHDLGDQSDPEITGYTCLCWIEKEVRHNIDYQPPIMRVHSANPVGRERMRRLIERIQRMCEEGGS